MEHLKKYLEENKKRFLDELFELLKKPSISANKNYKKETLETAELVKKSLLNAGVDKAEICKTEGLPVVYGEKIIDKKLPTIVIYGHYDVQPVNPINLWNTPPFEPTIKKTDIHPNGAIFARGACDDKGQFFMHIKAFEMMVKNNCLPCNVKFMIEGEEEIGSKSLEKFIKTNKEKLSGDIIIISDTGMIDNNIPSITIGLRGLSYIEIELTGPNRDLHSGLYGGAIANPINILSKMIASLHNENNYITIPSFYDKVETPIQSERDVIKKIPFNIKKYKTHLEIDETHGEANYTTIERTTIRPTLDVNGIWGGYTEEGAKTVIPSKAYAKISMRLVPNQNPEKITELFIKHIKKITPKYVKVKLYSFHGGQPYICPINSKAYKAAEYAIEKTFGKTPIPMRSGGSIPIVALFEKELKMKSILMGFGLDSDAIHSPNEHYGLFNFYKGIETIPYYFEKFTKTYNEK